MLPKHKNKKCKACNLKIISEKTGITHLGDPIGVIGGQPADLGNKKPIDKKDGAVYNNS
ncbi:hypothetical protein AGMMS50276_28090 [Synergistales bacterium]|nr:hypothetical protein AGMMS50276_28090 [Synergistales bacterium]